MTERTYKVVVEALYTHEVVAETPEQAARIVLEGDSGNGICESVNVDRVVGADQSWSDEDLRARRPCVGGCGRTLAASRDDECTDCFLSRLMSQRKAGGAAGR